MDATFFCCFYIGEWTYMQNMPWVLKKLAESKRQKCQEWHKKKVDNYNEHLNSSAHNTDSQNRTLIVLFYPLNFNGKEKDHESGFHYYGARYYWGEVLTGWLSVDPMADKYPGISPYAYCAWNPIKLIDPDGNKIVATNTATQRYIEQYMIELFGSSDMFVFSENGEMKVKRKEYNAFYKTATKDQQLLLAGLRTAIRKRERATITVQDNSNCFKWHGETDLEECNPTAIIHKGKGMTSVDCYPALGHVIGIIDGVFDECLLSAGIDEDGNIRMIAPPSCTTFIHEVLDEFLNRIVKKAVSEKSPNLEKVFYQNTALRVLSLPERDGEDHDY